MLIPSIVILGIRALCFRLTEGEVGAALIGRLSTDVHRCPSVSRRQRKVYDGIAELMREAIADAVSVLDISAVVVDGGVGRLREGVDGGVFAVGSGLDGKLGAVGDSGIIGGGDDEARFRNLHLCLLQAVDGSEERRCALTETPLHTVCRYLKSCAVECRHAAADDRAYTHTQCRFICTACWYALTIIVEKKIPITLLAIADKH